MPKISNQTDNRRTFAIIIERTPLKTSIKKTIRAAFFPTCLKTLVAPVEPEPRSRRSMPFSHFPARKPVGNEPIK